MSEFLTASSETIRRVAGLLASGEIVALPTETVYGLGANALDDKAVDKIFAAKGRPQFNPLIAHVDSIAMAREYAEFSQTAELLAQTYWPGPLTLVLPLKPDSGISRKVTAGLKTIAMRRPAHDVMAQIITAFGKPIAAPSANISGRLSPTMPEHVADSFGDKIKYIVTGGKSQIGLESTIIDVSGEVPALLRAGAVTREEIEQLIGSIDDKTKNNNESAPASPGQLLKHYAPKTPLRLNAVDVDKDEALLAFGSVKFMGVRSGGHVRDLPLSHYLNLSETGDLQEAASNLFSMLHRLDRLGAKAIAVMNIPDRDVGRAINDRLLRAAHGSGCGSRSGSESA